MKKTVYVTHCIDTEGPLYESVSATFVRLKEIFNIDLEPSPSNLRKLQESKIDLGGIEKDVASVVSPKLLNYNSTWDQINTMLDNILSESYRNNFLDSYGKGWIYNWFIMDHVGFIENPRRRDIGYHNILDFYLDKLKQTSSTLDGVYLHHHPIPFNKKANTPATHYFSHTPLIFEIISRRLLDRQFYHSVYRPGFHTTRPDSHWLLEQFIPFEYANQYMEEESINFQDLGEGRFGDWRRAPNSWEPYHPSHDDYQQKGNCRRLIARCLNVGTRSRLLTQNHVDQAFIEASEGLPVVLSFNHHDFRDMRDDIEKVKELIASAKGRFPGVNFKFCDAREAMRLALAIPSKEPLTFNLNWNGNKLEIGANDLSFGPQPFFCIKTKSGNYFHDNLDFQIPFKKWSYVFDDITFPLNSLEKIGLGVCDTYGNVTVILIDPETKRILEKHY